MISELWKGFPEGLKRSIRSTGAMTSLKAKRLAASSKRLDICASQIASCFHLARHPSIEGKVCLEVGAGWVLTHSLICYLLGAKRVIATDLTACARPKVLSVAINRAVESIPRDVLAPFADYSGVRSRLDKLKRIDSFDFEVLSDLGIDYVSPLDLASDPLNQNVDFIYSNSVLEHVPVHNAEKLLRNLSHCLNPGGSMIHCIHLEDHKDSQSAPFEFLKIAHDEYTEFEQQQRGNRMRVSHWQKIFESLENCSSSAIYSHIREDVKPPIVSDLSVSYESEDELRVSHVGFFTRKEL